MFSSYYLWKVAFLSIYLGITVQVSYGKKSIPCEPVGFCACQFPSGLGVDLSPLRSLNLSIVIPNEGNLTFYPCKTIKVLNSTVSNTSLNECESGVSLCLEQHVGNDSKYLSFGKIIESQFDWTNQAFDPHLIFQHENRLTDLELKCNEESNQTNLELISRYNNINSLILSSPYACSITVTSEGTSVLSTLAIIALVLFLSYFISGFLVLKCIRGAQGWEAIPNSEFWKSSFLSFKQMCVFMANGCENPKVYDSI